MHVFMYVELKDFEVVANGALSGLGMIFRGDTGKGDNYFVTTTSDI